MSTEVCVIGVGMTPFKTPSSGIPYTEMGRQAIAEALEDAGLEFGDIQQAYAGYVYGDSTSGQRVLYQAGLTGIPIINVNNNCATGSTALFLARQAVQSGAVDCALALGFEQMSRGALGEMFDDRPSPIEPFMEVVNRVQGPSEAPLAPTLFGGAGREYMERYGIAAETFGRIASSGTPRSIGQPVILDWPTTASGRQCRMPIAVLAWTRSLVSPRNRRNGVLIMEASWPQVTLGPARTVPPRP